MLSIRALYKKRPIGASAAGTLIHSLKRGMLPLMTRHALAREAGAIEARLAPLGTIRRAAGAKAYLKSPLRFLGNDTPALRREVRGWRAGHPDWNIDAVCGLTEAVWRRRVFELRIFALELLVARSGELEPRHLDLLERLLRNSGTWALVDVIAPRLIGPLLTRHPRAAGRVLDRWARDEDFWMRRAALLALLLPMRRGDGDWQRFERYADPLLDDREFFIRKAIGWLLREAAARQPGSVVAFLTPRLDRFSGVTWREATRKLPARDRLRLDAARARALDATAIR